MSSRAGKGNTSEHAPPVSVVVPSYNQGDYIGETLESILCQKYPALQVIVIDGGSTDGTLEVLESFGDRVEWVSEPDGGLPHAVNKGFDRATGEIVGWLNSDDVYFDTGVVRRVADAFGTDPAADVVYGDAAAIGHDSRILRFRVLPPFEVDRLFRRNIIIQPAMFFRAATLREERLDESVSLATDYELWLRLAARGYQFRKLQSVLAGDRIHATRLSITRRDELRAQVREFRAKHGAADDSSRPARAVDRLALGVARWKGLRGVVQLGRDEVDLAFPGYLDSTSSLLMRQLFSSIAAVERREEQRIEAASSRSAEGRRAAA